MATISVSGSMYEANYVEVSDETVATLIALQKDGDMWDDLPELTDEIYGDSLINGFIFNKDQAYFDVVVDGEDQPSIVNQFMKTHANLPTSSSSPTSEGKNYLVYEKWHGRAQLSLETDGEFDPDELAIYEEALILPGGLVRQVAEISYEGEELKFEGSWTENESLCLVKKDGSFMELKV